MVMPAPCYGILIRVSQQKDIIMNKNISIDPQVCHGKPVIRRMHVLVATLLGAISGEDSIEDVLKDYPNITREDVLAAFEFAGRLSRFEEIPYEVTFS